MSEVATAATTDLSDRRTRLKYKMAETRQELLETLQALRPEQLSLPTRNEGWSVREVAAHIAAAEGGMEPIAKRILNHAPNQREVYANFDPERYNNSRIKKRADLSIAALIEELNTSRAQVLKIIDQARDEDFDMVGYHPTAGEITFYGLFVVIYRHERIHTEDIQLALKNAGVDFGTGQ